MSHRNPRPAATLRPAAPPPSLLEDEGFTMKLLPKPAQVQMKMLELYNLWKRNPKGIELEPEYQRESVWAKDRQSNLIESIMRQSFVPSIVFNAKMVRPPYGGKVFHHDFREVLNCVDGKQRLTAVFKFFEGEIAIKSDDATRRLWYYSQPMVNGVEVPVAGRRILCDEIKEHFERCTFTVSKYSDLDTDVEKEIFQSVQKGMPLNNAEKMRGLGTDYADFCRELEDQYPRIFGLCKNARGVGFNIAATALSAISEHDPSSDARAPLRLAGVLENFLKAGVEVSEDLSGRMISTLDKLSQLLRADPEINAAGIIGPKSGFSSKATYFEATTYNVPSFAPIDLVCAALLVYRNLSRPDALLLQDIKALRKSMRQRHRDLRMNAAVWKTAWEFIVTEMRKRLAGDYSGDVGDDAPASAPQAGAAENGHQPSNNEVEMRDAEQDTEQEANQDIVQENEQNAEHDEEQDSGDDWEDVEEIVEENEEEHAEEDVEMED